MKLNILLPAVERHPIGGFKVQYEYANRLAALGHDVVIYHSFNSDRRVLRDPRSLAGLVSWNIAGGRKIDWFPIDKSVRCRFLPNLIPRLLRPADVTMLTSWQTAERIPRATKRTGALFQTVFDYEYWSTVDPDVKSRIEQALRRSDVRHIATSGAVERMLTEIGVNPVAKIVCGVDIPIRSVIPATEDREAVVGFPLRGERLKGTSDMLAAVPIIQRQLPGVRFECFGDPQGVQLPEGVTALGYLSDPDLLAFYRRCMVFVLPSHAEGWGLPAVEAMANGAAVVVADNGGSGDFAIERTTASVVPVADPDAIAKATCELIEDRVVRSHLVAGGAALTRSMSWDKSVAQMLRLLRQTVPIH